MYTTIIYLKLKKLHNKIKIPEFVDVYLNDTEKKLSVFDDMLKKLKIFSTILNERQFVFKQLEISPDFGFRFRTEDGRKKFLMTL